MYHPTLDHSCAAFEEETPLRIEQFSCSLLYGLPANASSSVEIFSLQCSFTNFRLLILSSKFEAFTSASGVWRIFLSSMNSFTAIRISCISAALAITPNENCKFSRAWSIWAWDQGLLKNPTSATITMIIHTILIN